MLTGSDTARLTTLARRPRPGVFQAGSDSSLHRCLNGRAPPYQSDYCVPIAGADSRRHLRSANRQLLAVYIATGSTLTAIGPFQLPAPQSGTFSRISSKTLPSVQTVSYVCLKRVCLLDTSAFSALEVLDDNRAI